MSTSQLALARRYRPRDFQAVVGQEATLRALMSALDTQRLHHAYLLTGTRGVGKTTLARIFAKALNCEQGISSKPCGHCQACQAIDAGHYVDLIEVDAASRTKVEDTRELLENVQYLPSQGPFKIYLIDEVHMLSGHSFNALLKTLEEPPAHVKFILATTDPQKLPVTVLSRCLQFHLQRLDTLKIVTHLGEILKKENLNFETEALEILAFAADGSVRDALSLLDQAIAYGQGHIRAEEVRTLLGLTEKGRLLALFSAILKQDAAKALEEIKAIANTTTNFSAVLIEFLRLIHQLAMAQQLPEMLEDSPLDVKAILELANAAAPEEIQLYYQIALLGQRDLPYAPSPQMGFEMIVLRMLAFQPMSLADNTPTVSESISTPKPVPSQPSPASATHSSAAAPQPAPVKAQESRTSTLEFNPKESDWTRIVSSLNLTGMIKELANHCILRQLSDTHIHLALCDSRKPLLNKRNEEKLQELLGQYFKRAIVLNIQLDPALKHESDAQSPAQHHQAAKDKAQQQAQHSIETDPNVEELMQKFGAKIEQVSSHEL